MPKKTEVGKNTLHRLHSQYDAAEANKVVKELQKGINSIADYINAHSTPSENSIIEKRVEFVITLVLFFVGVIGAILLIVDTFQSDSATQLAKAGNVMAFLAAMLFIFVFLVKVGIRSCRDDAKGIAEILVQIIDAADGPGTPAARVTDATPSQKSPDVSAADVSSVSDQNISSPGFNLNSSVPITSRSGPIDSTPQSPLPKISESPSLPLPSHPLSPSDISLRIHDESPTSNSGPGSGQLPVDKPSESRYNNRFEYNNMYNRSSRAYGSPAGSRAQYY